jgi:hypothetical protein
MHITDRKDIDLILKEIGSCLRCEPSLWRDRLLNKTTNREVTVVIGSWKTTVKDEIDLKLVEGYLVSCLDRHFIPWSYYFKEECK